MTPTFCHFLFSSQHYKTFTIYECRRIHPQKGQDAPDDQFFLLDENRYIADILVDLKSKNDKNGKVCRADVASRVRKLRWVGKAGYKVAALSGLKELLPVSKAPQPSDLASWDMHCLTAGRHQQAGVQEAPLPRRGRTHR